MGLPTRSRWASPGTAAVLLLAACAALMPGEVEAGCHHLWVKTAGPASPLDDLELLVLGDGQPHLPVDLPAPPGRGSPCANGRCSPAPDLPAGTQTRTEPGDDARGLAPALITGFDATSHRLTPERSHPTPIHLAHRLERPPRPLDPSGDR